MWQEQTLLKPFTSWAIIDYNYKKHMTLSCQGTHTKSCPCPQYSQSSNKSWARLKIYYMWIQFNFSAVSYHNGTSCYQKILEKIAEILHRDKQILLHTDWLPLVNFFCCGTIALFVITITKLHRLYKLMFVLVPFELQRYRNNSP